MDVSYQVAQVGGQISGGEIARPTGAGRPVAAIGPYEAHTQKLSLNGRSGDKDGGNFNELDSPWRARAVGRTGYGYGTLEHSEPDRWQHQRNP